MKSKVITLFVAITLVNSCLQAQEKLTNDTFRVVKEYQPILIDADKIDFSPEINDTFKIERKLEYSFIDKPQAVSFELEPIKAARIKGEPLVKLYNGYARLGVGNVLIPFAEVYYTNLRSKDFQMGVHAAYLNQTEAAGIEGSDFTKTHFEVFGKRFWKKNTFEAKASYDLHNLNYYGYYDIPRIIESEIPADQLEQSYHQLNLDMRLSSTKQDSFNLRHEVNTHFHHFFNKDNQSEQQFKATAKLSQIFDQELYELDLLADYNNYELAQASGIFALKPQISTIGERFKVKAGLGIYANVNESANFHFYPLAEVKYDVVDDILIPYLGVKGEIQRNSYQSITQENPFVNPNLNLQNSNQQFNLYAGLRGTLSKNVSFNTSASRLRTDDAYFYFKSSEGNTVLDQGFNLAYDRLDEWRLKGELVYRLNEKIQLFALGEYFVFDTENLAEAWHRPELKLNLKGTYNLRDKIIAKAAIFYWGEQFAPSISAITVNQNNQIISRTESIETLSAIIDLNIAFEYRYTKKLSAFIEFNNLLGLNYQKYQDYPLQGFNTWGGLTYSF